VGGRLAVHIDRDALCEAVREVLPELLPPPAPARDEQYLTLAHASERFDVPQETLRHYLKTKKLTKHLICGRVHVRVSEIVAAEGAGIESPPLGRAALGGGKRGRR
jgi:hypothetical protein